jgi:two-component system C4-dicarboxylate transport sensor histidine kinase DctB
MTPAGDTLAASNWGQEDSFVGRNFAFRPYFREAMAGRPGRFFGLGTTSGKRGYFFAAAVQDGAQPLGVLVVKVDLDFTETLWGNTPEQLLVTDANGVVILTSNSAWRFTASRPLDAAERAAIAANLPYPTQSPSPLQLDTQNWIRQDREMAETHWTVSILAPRSLLDRPVRTALVAGGGLLLLLLLLLGLPMQRRRHYLERIALDARARQQLEQRVLERTHDLELLNSRLKQ